MNTLISLLVIVTLCGFLGAILGLLCAGIQLVRDFRRRDNWRRNGDSWTRWTRTP